jgi:N-formylmaleamate deformylase
MHVRGVVATRTFGAEPDIAAWANSCALDPSRIEPSRRDARRLADHAAPGLTRLAELAGEPLSARSRSWPDAHCTSGSDRVALAFGRVPAVAWAVTSNATTDDAPKAFVPTAFGVKVSGRGRPVIFIPGFACGGSVWDGTVAHLDGRVEAHVLTFAGIAGQPPVASPSLADVRDQIERYIVDNQLDRPVIVGHSLGGTMALWVGETVSQLGGIIDVDGTAFLPALNAPTITREQAEATGKARAETIAALGAAELRAFVRTMMSNMFSQPEDLDRMVAEAASSDVATLAAHFAEGFATDLRAALGKITTHVTLIVASDDPTSEQLQARWRAHVTGIKELDLTFIAGKHFLMLDQPDRFYAMLDNALARGAACTAKPTGTT